MHHIALFIYRKAFSLFPGTGNLNGCIQGKEIGLGCDICRRSGLLGCKADVGNVVRDTVDTCTDVLSPVIFLFDSSAALLVFLSFVDVMDICSIFVNALDNAVESVLKIPDKDKRLIHVTVSRQKEFLLIRFENYFEQDLQIDRGNLVSTKSDKDFHGYGIKSIRYTVE